MNAATSRRGFRLFRVRPTLRGPGDRLLRSGFAGPVRFLHLSGDLANLSIHRPPSAFALGRVPRFPGRLNECRSHPKAGQTRSVGSFRAIGVLFAQHCMHSTYPGLASLLRRVRGRDRSCCGKRSAFFRSSPDTRDAVSSQSGSMVLKGRGRRPSRSQASGEAEARLISAIEPAKHQGTAEISQMKHVVLEERGPRPRQSQASGEAEARPIPATDAAKHLVAGRNQSNRRAKLHTCHSAPV